MSMAGLEEYEPNSVTEEISYLKKVKNCRVLNDIGDFIHVIDVIVPKTGIGIKFQLEDSYPKTAPHIIVKPGFLDSMLQEELSLHLSSEATLQLNSFVIKHLMHAAEKWFFKKECQGVHFHVSPKPQHKHKQKYQSKSRVKGNSSLEEEIKKKSPMKTAEDVISRIIWDEALPTDCFNIGYLDRFIGVVEKNFSAFSWEDIASVDWDELAIPKHRIQYFKYKSKIVWDKSKRLDLVFGSTGSKKIIHDVIKEVDEEETNNKKYRNHFGNYEESDSEEEIVITGFSPRSSKSPSSEISCISDNSPWPREAYWGSRLKPTHFLALRVTDLKIIENMQKIHDRILDIVPSYYESIIPTYRLHVTLCCLGLDDEEQINHAVHALEKIQPKLASLNPQKFKLKFSGVDNFYHKVLYAAVEENDDFLHFVDSLRNMIKAEDIQVRDMFSFTPHMTILKISEKQGKSMNNPYIDGRCYLDLAKTQFGSQVVDNIHLCEMSQARDTLGFYVCNTFLKF